MLSGLAHVHAHGYVHLDVKPSNVVYDHINSTFVIIDFGLARKRGPSGTRVGGTWGYRGPEHVLGSCCALPSSDLWSLGIMVLHVLHGQAILAIPRPGDRSTAAELERACAVCGERALMALAAQLGVRWPPEDARGARTGERVEQVFAPSERVIAIDREHDYIRSLAEALLAPHPAQRIQAASALDELRAFRSNARAVPPVRTSYEALVDAIDRPAPDALPAAPLGPTQQRSARVPRSAALGAAGRAGRGAAWSKRATGGGGLDLEFERSHSACNHVFNHTASY